MGGSSPPPVSGGWFEGPLDLLLAEVRRQKVAIEEVNLAPVVGRFLEYLRTAKASNLNLDIEWLHMAATLVHWKSRVLLPVAPGRELPGDPVRDELVRQLLAHRQQLAGELARRKLDEERQYPRAAGAPGDSRPADHNLPENPAFESVWDLLQQARELGRWVAEQKAVRRDLQRTWEVAAEEVTVGAMCDWLRAELNIAGEIRVDGLQLLVRLSPARRSCLFLGMLEMARSQEIEIEQREHFGFMSIQRLPSGLPAKAARPPSKLYCLHQV
jgi:chromatin segregation and condensation protein Rec8/ScpA/Scc1 (kleisin family)